MKLKQPILILFVGVPCSGKSTLARELCRRIGNSAYCSKDMFQSVFTDEGIDSEVYEEISGPTVDFLLKFCDEHLKLGKSPIIDAPYTINRWRNDKYRNFQKFYNKIAEKNNTKLLIIQCNLKDYNSLKKRIVKRGLQRDVWKLDHWDEFVKREPMNQPIAHKYVLKLTTDSPIVELISKIQNFIKDNL